MCTGDCVAMEVKREDAVVYCALISYACRPFCYIDTLSILLATLKRDYY